MLEYHKMTEAEKKAICGWRYPGEYAVYDLPPYEEQLKAHRSLANLANDFYAFVERKMLIGYIDLVDEGTEVFFGIGVHPDYCDRGCGQRLSRMACDISRQLYSGMPVYLEVRTRNQRAIKCYEKAGFRVNGAPIARTTPLGEGLFYRMVHHE